MATSADAASRTPASPDLAARLRLCQTPLRRQLARADVLTEMIRAVNASLDPERVAEAMLLRLSAWGAGRRLVDRRGRRGSTRRQSPPRAVRKDRSVAHAVARHGGAIGGRFASADLSQTARFPGRRRSRVGLSAPCRGRTSGPSSRSTGACRAANPASPRRPRGSNRPSSRRDCARQRLAGPARRGALGDGRSDVPLQLAVPRAGVRARTKSASRSGGRPLSLLSLTSMVLRRSTTPMGTCSAAGRWSRPPR